MTRKTTKLVFFDFDGTLTKHETLPTILRGIRQHNLIKWWFYAGKALFRQWQGARYATKPDDFRTHFKCALLEVYLKGITLTQVQQRIKHVHIFYRNDIVQKLLEHKKAGDKIIIASGNLDIALPHLLRQAGIPYDHILSTQMGQANGQLTGHIVGDNCVRDIKQAQVKHYIEHWQKQNISVTSIAYGNSKSDIPMLELVDYGNMV